MKRIFCSVRIRLKLGYLDFPFNLLLANCMTLITSGNASNEIIIQSMIHVYIVIILTSWRYP